MIEEWKPVVGYEGLYSVSDQGRVRSEPRRTNIRNGNTRTVPSKVLAVAAPTKHEKYPTVNLWRNNFLRKQRIHNLVALAFLGPRPESMEILHWNDIPTDNRLTNLRYGTHAENGSDTTRNRLACTHGHEFTEANTYIRRDTGIRQCLTCMKDRNDSRPRKTTATRQRKTSLPQHDLPNPKSPIQCGGKE